MSKLGNIFDFQNDPDHANYDGSSDNNNNNKPNLPKPRKQMVIYWLIAIGVIILINTVVLPALANRNVVQTGYDDFLNAIEEKTINEVELDDSTIRYTLKDDGDAVYETGRIEYFGEVDRLYNSGAKFTQEIPTTISPIWVIIYNLLPFALFIWLGMRLSKNLTAGGGMFGGLGKANAKIYVKDKTGITFDDVAGEDEAKELLAEMVEFLHDPGKYKEIGALIPKGALLVGPPGTGKTLLAKAVAGEADVPFFSISGSEFVEMFVGMGAAKVRDLFREAEKKAPCIIFIDEIDAIGKKRGTGALGGNDEREQTLNQLLTEMDGFDGSKGIIVLAATNQPEVLDPALLRPGRFDRRVPVELPDMQGRVEILEVHAKHVKMDPGIDFEAIAKACPGASGAELANMVNEAALRAVKAGRTRVSQQDLEESIDVVMAGYKKKNKVLTEKEKLIVAYHEVGHAMVAAMQSDSAPVHKITIIPRTSGALGFTMQVEEEGNHYLLNKEELQNKIATLTGGRVAEEIVFKTITTGAANDIEQATKIARNMVSFYGMNDEFGMVALEAKGNAYLGGDMSMTCSDGIQAQVDAEVIRLIGEQHDKARKLLEDNIMKLHEIAKYLYEKETISGDEFMAILNAKENTLVDSAAEAEEKDETKDVVADAVKAAFEAGKSADQGENPPADKSDNLSADKGENPSVGMSESQPADKNENPSANQN